MSATAPSVPIRLQLQLASNPPVFPFDTNTGLAPQIWRGEDATFQIGIFSPDGGCVDLSNLMLLEVDIFPLPILNQRVETNFSYTPFSTLPFPTIPSAPLLYQTVLAENLVTSITVQEWENGTNQQAEVTFPWIDTQSLDLGGRPMRQFWINVRGFTQSGRRLVYGGSRLDVYESGSQGIYLPNSVAPLSIPDGTILLVAPNTQLTFGSTIDVDCGGQGVIEGQLIQIQ